MRIATRSLVGPRLAIVTSVMIALNLSSLDRDTQTQQNDSSVTILVVDDQPMILRVFAEALERAGYRVRVAVNATDAIDCVQTEPPDAILIDLLMPFVNGLGLLYRLRDIAPQIPVAMVTGGAVTVEMQDELNLLGVAVHYKPLTASQIQAVVAKLVHVTADALT